MEARRRFLVLIVTAAALLVGWNNVSAEVVIPAVICVDENHPIKPVDQRLLGFNHEWVGQIPNCAIPGAAGYNTNVVTTLAGRLSLPLNRMSGTVSQKFSWEGAIGPYEQRTEQDLVDWWSSPQKIGCGPVEWIQMVQSADSSAHFTWTVNLYETPEQAADLVEFLTGDGVTNYNGGVNWAQVRIGYGITNPVLVDVWELGNEMDGTEFREDFQNITNYTDLCKPFITAIRTVQPDAKIAAHAMTHSSYNDYQAYFGVPWTEWHRNVLRELGDDIDYMAFHVYYNSLPSSTMESQVKTIENDILSITGSDRIKMYMSEYSWWPKTNDCPPGTTTAWKDSWYTTHSLLGCLGTADWMTRMMNSSSLEIAGYHAFSGGGWSLMYKSADSNLYTTGIAELYALFNDAFRDGVSIVQTDVSGTGTDHTVSSCLFTAAALTTPDGVNLIIANRDTNTVRSVDLNFLRQYVLVEKTVFTAPELLSYNTSTNRPITITRTTFPSGETLKGILIPAKSAVILKVRPAAVSASFDAYQAPCVLSSNTSSGTAISQHVALQDSSGGDKFTVWGSTGTTGSYSLKILEDGEGRNYLSLNSTRTSGSPVAQVSTTSTLELSDNWCVKTRFSATAGNGSLYFGLYASGAMTSFGGYDYTRLICANTNTAAVALGFSISSAGNAVVTRTAANNKLEFWNGSAWVTSGSGAYAATGLDVTGRTQYDLALSSDGTVLNVSLLSAETHVSLMNLDSPVSELGTNITSSNTVRFSAGDVANNSTDGWTANIYDLSIESAPGVSVDLNAYPVPYEISANTSSGISTNEHVELLDSSASGMFTVWGSTGSSGSYSLDVLGESTDSNYLKLSTTKGTSAYNLLAQVSTTLALPLSNQWAIKTRFSAATQASADGCVYFGLYAADAMSSIGGYELKQISSPNTNTAAAALQLAISCSGDGYITRTGSANILQYWTGSAWSTSSTRAVSNLNVTGNAQYDLILSTDGTTMNLSLMNATNGALLISVNSSVCDLGSNIRGSGEVRFSAGDIGNNTASGWDAGIYAISLRSTPTVSADFNAYEAVDVISSNTSSGTAISDHIVLQDSSDGADFTVWGSTGPTGSYSLDIFGENCGSNYLHISSTKISGAYSPIAQVSSTSARSLWGSWIAKTRFSATAGNGSLYFGLYKDDVMTAVGGFDYTRLLSANTNTAAVALGFSISSSGNAVVTRTAVNNCLEFWNGSAWVASGSGAYAATGLDVTGATKYDLTVSSDGATLSINLMNASTFTSLINLNSSISELGSNITEKGMVRFSAGDVASNSTDGWNANIYSLSLVTLSLVDPLTFFE